MTVDMSLEAAATKLRKLRDSEMAVGRGPKPMGEDYEWIEEIVAAFAGDAVLYVDALEHDKDDEDGRCKNLRCLDPGWAYGTCYGIVQFYPEVK